MIVVEIQDPADGRVGHEVGPFPSLAVAEHWRQSFLAQVEHDPDFVEVREVEHRLLDPRSPTTWGEVLSFYG